MTEAVEVGGTNRRQYRNSKMVEDGETGVAGVFGLICGGKGLNISSGSLHSIIGGLDRLRWAKS